MDRLCIPTQDSAVFSLFCDTYIQDATAGTEDAKNTSNTSIETQLQK